MASGEMEPLLLPAKTTPGGESEGAASAGGMADTLPRGDETDVETEAESPASENAEPSMAPSL
jgi:hypothetical protein